MIAETRSNRRVVLLICDGHRADFVTPDYCPEIAAFSAESRRFGNHTAIFPSATRASAASIATGCWPATHGLHGNMMGLPEAGGVRIHDVGDPAFRGKMREAFGRTLRVPTLAERLANHGGAVIASNVSPGAAYFHDPDHFGEVVHRAGAFGPGGRPLTADEAPIVSHDAAGDRDLTRWMCGRAIVRGGPALSVLWLSDPDLSMHADALGSTTHLAGIAAADACFAEARDAVEALRAQGEDVLFIVASDHGQETVMAHVAVDDLLVGAGLKDHADSTEVVVAPQGGSGLVYMAGEGLARRDRVAAFLADHPAIAEVFVGDAMRPLGQAPEAGLQIAFAMARDEAPNGNGVPGRITLCVSGGVSGAKPGKPVGRGSHGGLGRFERHPFLIVNGGGFAAGTIEYGRSHLVDIAPTILRHLGLPRHGMDGMALSRN
ncbi:alkaline phosphatase family protein [Fodinicurvata sp. EGI_FJ10296]|uniref:alkaline phosphatase family protein n=1 Tax=Fodinicurvata sp. EGI_FJ10296 TaxID=3231908 RepID=UPI003452C410